LGGNFFNIGTEAWQPLEHGSLVMKMVSLALVPAPLFPVSAFVLLLLLMFFVFSAQVMTISM